MNAKLTFNDILKQVEGSKLNYLISKTPFSANISLKCSFAQNHAKPGQAHIDQHLDAKATVKSEDTKESFDHHDKLVKEVLKLKSKLDGLQDTIKKQNQVIEDQSKQLKNTEKVAEEQAAEFREQLLKVKKEKNKLAAQNRTIEDENEMFKNEIENVKKEHGKFIEEKNVLENQVETLKKAQTTLEGINKKLNEETLRYRYQCGDCADQWKTQEELKNHHQTKHCKDETHQVEISNEEEEFREYSCYYCCKRIKSKDDLEKHKPVCYTIKEFSAYPCDECGAQCPQEADLGHHRTTYHELGTFSQKLRSELWWCDMCPVTYRSQAKLKDHIRICHEGYF